jgi:hypothetical protein
MDVGEFLFGDLVFPVHHRRADLLDGAPEATDFHAKKRGKSVGAVGFCFF